MESIAPMLKEGMYTIFRLKTEDFLYDFFPSTMKQGVVELFSIVYIISVHLMEGSCVMLDGSDVP